LSNDKSDAQTKATSTAGAYSLSEILSQPACWEGCLQLLDTGPQAQEAASMFWGTEEWLFIGCGSSYYVALAAAACWKQITGIRARAIPASELLLFPDLILDQRHFCPVLISRSGRTSEVLKAAEFLKAKNIRSLAITCAADQPLEKLATMTICLLPADERSTVMTRSFTSMLLAIQYLASKVAKEEKAIDELRRLPQAAEQFLTSLLRRVREFVGTYRFADYICLGQGPFYGLACESALKLTEMSVSYGQSFHTLEFRHGPKSVVGPETLLLFLLSETGYQDEVEVLEEMKRLGATTLVVANKADRRAHAAADFLLDLGTDLSEFSRIAPYVFAGQLMGLYTGLNKGLDPDHPRNLSRVVVLDDEKSSETTEHAAL
jgi:glutamine---fructose-6-phosphate transaminase (isomerizing)